MRYYGRASSARHRPPPPPAVSQILVLYYSRRGSVRELARAVAAGVESVRGCEAALRTVPAVSTVCEAAESDIPKSGDIYAALDDLESCDGLILGSPTRFGAIAAPLKHFFDQTAGLWMAGALDGKPCGVFTSGGSQHGGQESTLLSMLLPLIHHGMVAVGIPFSGTRLADTKAGGAPYGASHVAGANADSTLSADEIAFADILGRRVAKCAMALATAGVAGA